MLTGENKLEYNKRYTWDEIAEAYPNMYVFLADVEEDAGGGIVGAVLLGACDYDHAAETLARVVEIGRKFTVHRTITESPIVDILC